MKDNCSAVRCAAKSLIEAEHSREPCTPVRFGLPANDVDVAYRVQTEVIQSHILSGREPVGHKIGLTSVAVQDQLGVDQPDSGILFADMKYGERDIIPMSRLMQPKVEAEVGFIIGRDLDGDELSVDSVRRAIDCCFAALEIVDSRVANWDISIVDTVADNASSGLFVMGDSRVPLTQLDLVGLKMRLEVDGKQLSQGIGRACMGNPLNAALWLARTARYFGHPLRAGDIILSGALGPMVTVHPGDQVSAEIDGLGTIEASFSE